MAVTVAGVLGGRLLGGIGWIDGVLGAAKVLGTHNLRRLVIPGLLTTGKALLLLLIHESMLTLSVVLAATYAITSIPTSLPRRLSAKVSTQLAALDFTHSNALRISAEVRKALQFPADHLRSGLQKSFEELQSRREETNRVRAESEIARKYFGNLVRESADVKAVVEAVDLDGPAPGVAAGEY